MSNYMSTARILPTDNLSERARAVAYFKKVDIQTAYYLCESRRNKDILITVHNIPVAILEAKRRYFSGCEFIKLIF